jgi:hypothetical protein
MLKLPAVWSQAPTRDACQQQNFLSVAPPGGQHAGLLRWQLLAKQAGAHLRAPSLPAAGQAGLPR